MGVWIPSTYWKASIYDTRDIHRFSWYVRMIHWVLGVSQLPFSLSFDEEFLQSHESYAIWCNLPFGYIIEVRDSVGMRLIVQLSSCSKLNSIDPLSWPCGPCPPRLVNPYRLGLSNLISAGITIANRAGKMKSPTGSSWIVYTVYPLYNSLYAHCSCYILQTMPC